MPQKRLELLKALTLNQVGVPISTSHRGKNILKKKEWQRSKDSDLGMLGSKPSAFDQTWRLPYKLDPLVYVAIHITIYLPGLRKAC